MQITRELIPLNGAQFSIAALPSQDAAKPTLVWAHGWGQSGEFLLPMAESLAAFDSSYLIDFPGFGHSPLPPAPWGTEDYADATALWLHSLPRKPLLWIGHSFGCRIGIQLAARHPGLFSGMVLMAAAGLQRKRSPIQQLKFTSRVALYKIAKTFVPEGPARDRLRKSFGSSDYQQSNPGLRPILVKVVNEDLSPQAAQVTIPTLLLYGADDTTTPPEIGQRLHKLIPNSQLVLLDGFDHYTILSRGRHQALQQIVQFMRSLPA